MNPFLQNAFKTPFGSIPFQKIKNEHFLPALKELISRAKENIEDMKKNDAPANFENVIGVFERNDELLNPIVNSFFNLHSAESNDEIRDLAKEFSPILTEYGNDITLDAGVFSKIKELYDSRSSLDLNQEQLKYIEDEYKSFVRNGALLQGEQKEKLREIDKKLSDLSLRFSDNVLKETNDYLMLIEAEEDLAGLPEDFVEASAQLAKEKNHEGKWAVSLDYPSYGPFMDYSEKPELRKELAEAMSMRAFKGNENDNQDICKEITNLRYERSKLLGYEDHASFVLEKRMAASSSKVMDFLNELNNKAIDAAKRDMKSLAEFKNQRDGGELNRWDTAYYRRLLKQEKFGFDPEDLKPYFQLENVIEGAFTVAGKLYNLKFTEVKEVEVYHEDVKVFKIDDTETGKYIGLIYTDFFPRAGKRGGAWMTDYLDQRYIAGKDRRPHVAIVCNFTKPTPSKPSLLTFGEVTTLFHEFGHALHGLLSECQYGGQAGTRVEWDFVELPSQVLENWCYEKECLDLFAKHYKTGESIPEDLIQKLRDSMTFFEGVNTMRQLKYGLLDMAWHLGNPADIESVKALEDKIDKETNIYDFPTEPVGAASVAFSHIFAGGYSAGYYSYKWAEVLDADAFEAFKEKGIFNKEVAASFRSNILSRGGTQHPMELYKKFRGKEPSIDPLLKRAGLI